MASLVAQAIAAEIGPQEPWPDDVSFFQPYEASQILLPDNAQCLSVKTYLNMCALGYKEEHRVNAEEMSPSGRVPFIQVGAFLLSELDPIIAFINNKGFSLSKDFSDCDKSEMRAYMSLVENILINAELYTAWCEETVYSEVTRCRYGGVHPWPLSLILPAKKRFEVKSKLSTTGWAQKNMNEVCDEVITCCQALSERLDKQTYFFGDKPTELDALVFGHLYTILTTTLPISRLAEIVRSYSNLSDFCQRIDEKYFRSGSEEEFDWTHFKSQSRT